MFKLSRARIFSFLCVAVAINSCSNFETSRQQAKHVSLQQLLDDYESNELSADVKYRGQAITFDGFVQATGLGQNNVVLLSISPKPIAPPDLLKLSPMERAVEAMKVPRTGMCYLNLGMQRQVGELTVGQPIQVVAEPRPLRNVKGFAGYGNSVVLDFCEFSTQSISKTVR